METENQVRDRLWLLGTWHLNRLELRHGDGTVTHPMSENPVGQLVYDDAGNMSAHLVNPNPPERPSGIADGEAYEARISYDRYTSYFGGYSVDTDRNTVSHALIASLMPGWGGTTVVRNYRFEDPDTLILSAETGNDGQMAVLRWSRATPIRTAGPA